MTAKQWGYWTDLSSVTFADVPPAEGEVEGKWIQAMPLGDYVHPTYGEIQVTSDKVQQFAQGVKDKIRGQDLDIDYDHKEYGGEAAGWVADAEARPDGLWLLVNWTKKAAGLLKDKAYRYFSPEFTDEWTHPKTQQKYANVLFGGAITNRPFLKDILPINMSELLEGAGPKAPPKVEHPKKEGGEMDGKLLRLAMGLAEDATDEVVLAEIVKRNAAKVDPPTGPKTPEVLKFDINKPETVAAALQQLADVKGNPAIKALRDIIEAQQSQLTSLDLERREARVAKMLDDLDRGKQFAVPPAVKDNLREMLLNSPDGLGQQVYEAYQKTFEVGVIDLTEKGWQRRGGESSPVQNFLTEVDNVMTKSGGKMTYAEATMAVSRNNPELARQYREESYIPEGR